MFSEFFNNLYAKLDKLPFDTLIYIIWGSYIVLFLAVLISAACSEKIKSASKKPFLYLTNVYAAVTFAAFALKCEIAPSLTAAVIFWIIGYLLYGAMYGLTKRHLNKKERVEQTACSPAFTPPPKPIRTETQVQAQAPAARNSVRLDHAITVTDKLLTKNLAKGDRQELEKLKNTLAVLKIKGTLTPAEADILNENFNALLKLMAKYNV